MVYTNSSYKRIEKIEGKVAHVFALPRNSIGKEYKDQVNNNAKNNIEEMPERTIVTWKENIDELVGHFLADSFGLPKSEEWANRYIHSLPADKLQVVDVQTTSMAGEMKDLQSIIVKPMKVEEVLSYIEEDIRNGYLKTTSDKLELKAEFEENWSTEDYLRANTKQLVSKIDTYMKPLYDGTHYSKHIGYTNRVSVPAQARCVMGLLGVLKEKIGAFLVGDMGTGKTQISLTTAFTKAREREDSGAQDGFRSLIVAPSNVLPKWATSEIPTTLGKSCIVEPSQLLKLEQFKHSNKIGEVRLWRKYNESKIIVSTLGNTEDALKYIELVKSGWKVPKGKIHFVLVSTDRMKLHAQGFVLGAKWNSRRSQWISPETGIALQSPRTKKDNLKDGLTAEWQDVILDPPFPPTQSEIDDAREKGELNTHGVPIGYIIKWKKEVRSYQDDYTSKKNNRILARPSVKSLHETKFNSRWMIAQLFQRKLPNHFHFGIFDEIHQMKAQGSGRGLAFHKLLKSCRKSVFLTGTLTNGASSSIQAVLWRVFPHELIKHGFTSKTSAEHWAERYGVLERTRKLNDNSSEVGVTTNRRNEVIIKEMPGVSPELVANHLLDKSVFLDLPDLNIPMITLEEKPVIIPLDEDHYDDYQRFHNDMYETCKSLQKEMGTSAWSRFNPALLNYADQPQLEMNVKFINRNDELLGELNPQTYPKVYETDKERKLVELVQERLANDRGIIIYTNFTQGYKTNERLKKVLNRYDIDPVILDGKVSAEKRFDWIENETEKGTKVVITNQRLVEVGLDLLAFPTIIFWQMNDNINTVRQSAKRAHRLGQNKHCEVLYLVNEETQQMAQFQRLMSRRVSALLVEGAIEQSDDLAKYADLSVAELTNDLSKSLASSDIASIWEQTAQKELDSSLEMVSEEELQDKISEAFASLTQETKDLCGYIEPEVIEVETKDEDDSSFDTGYEVIEHINVEDALNDNNYDGISLFDFEDKEKIQKEEVKSKGRKKAADDKEEYFEEQISLFDLVI